MAGTLFVVATPIGNLEDITLRALRVLREVDLIAAEDTRRTSKLLTHYDIRRPMTSLREHNEARMAATLVARLEGGESIALVSDAGTPGLADPGQKLVNLARQRGITVVPVPGASAVTAAISASGWISANSFLGFLQHRPAEWLNRHGGGRTVVFFEAPHRIARTRSWRSRLVDRPIMVFREYQKYTKICYSANLGGSDDPPCQIRGVVCPGNAVADSKATTDSTEPTSCKSRRAYDWRA
jgi:16S rRNA (cytidine1402-2'-O)-methyltransferase